MHQVAGADVRLRGKSRELLSEEQTAREPHVPRRREDSRDVPATRGQWCYGARDEDRFDRRSQQSEGRVRKDRSRVVRVASGRRVDCEAEGKTEEGSHDQRSRRRMILVGQYDSPYVRRVAVSLHVLELPFERNTLSVFADADAMRA